MVPASYGRQWANMLGINKNEVRRVPFSLAAGSLKGGAPAVAIFALYTVALDHFLGYVLSETPATMQVAFFLLKLSVGLTWLLSRGTTQCRWGYHPLLFCG